MKWWSHRQREILKLKKVDGKDKTLKLEGAKFQLQDKKGNVIKVNGKRNE